MPSEQAPGFLAKVEVVGANYKDMELDAISMFRGLFQDTDWALLGAQIQPEQMDQGFGPSNVIQWSGTFFALTQGHHNGDS